MTKPHALTEDQSDQNMYALLEELHALLAKHQVTPCERVALTAWQDGYRMELTADRADGHMIWTAAIGADDAHPHKHGPTPKR